MCRVFSVAQLTEDINTYCEAGKAEWWLKGLVCMRRGMAPSHESPKSQAIIMSAEQKQLYLPDSHIWKGRIACVHAVHTCICTTAHLQAKLMAY